MQRIDTPLLVFDLDGTLVDSIPGLATSLRAVLVPQPDYTVSEVRSMIGDGVEALVRRALLARSRAFDPALLHAFVADYTARAGRDDALFPDVVDTLAALQPSWRLAVCTNKPEAAARALLDRLGLGNTFAAVAGGDSFPVRKPHPGHVMGTVKAAGGGPAVMVGDHANDIRSAAGAGVACIFAGWGYGTPAMADGAPVAAGFADVPALAAGLVRAQR